MSSKSTFYRRKRATLSSKRSLCLGISKDNSGHEGSSSSTVFNQCLQRTSEDVIGTNETCVPNSFVDASPDCDINRRVELVEPSCLPLNEMNAGSLEEEKESNPPAMGMETPEHLLNTASSSNIQLFQDTLCQPPRKEVIMFGELITKHNLTNSCIEDIFKVFNKSILCARPITSLTQVDKELQLGHFNATFNWNCSECNNFKEVNYKDTPYNVSCCSKIGINSDHFIILGSREILQGFLNGKIVNDEHYEKKKAMVSNGLAVKNDIFVTLNTDGATLFKSSNSSLWPILGVVDGMAHHDKKKNVALLGMWISKGSKKPSFTPFINGVLNDLKKLIDNPIQWTDRNGMLRTSRVFVSSILCDSIARPAVQMVSQFNGQYGCGVCYHDEKGHYFKHCESMLLRSHTDYLAALEVVEGNRFGVQASSPMLNALHFDVIFDFPIDVLHTVYLGVTAMITEALLSNKKTPYYLPESDLDRELLQIKPPKRVSRLPRSMKYKGSFKGHEWNMWLLYYSPIVLLGKLPNEYYSHWLLLVNGISLLTTSSNLLTERMIQRAQSCLNDFSTKVEKLYGRSSCRYNVHLLLHLPIFVRRFGPLYLYSMTVFENFNMVLSKYVKSSYGVGAQIVKSYLRDVRVRFFANQNPIAESTQEGLSEMFVKLPNNYVSFLHQMYDKNLTFRVFSRCRNKKGNILHSSSYNQITKRNNFWFTMSSDTVIRVVYFLEYNDPNHNLIAVGEKYLIHDSIEVQVDHIFEITFAGIHLCDVNSLYENVFTIQKADKTFVVSFVNNVECNVE